MNYNAGKNMDCSIASRYIQLRDINEEKRAKALAVFTFPVILP